MKIKNIFTIGLAMMYAGCLLTSCFGEKIPSSLEKNIIEEELLPPINKDEQQKPYRFIHYKYTTYV